MAASTIPQKRKKVLWQRRFEAQRRAYRRVGEKSKRLMFPVERLEEDAPLSSRGRKEQTANKRDGAERRRLTIIECRDIRAGASLQPAKKRGQKTKGMAGQIARHKYPKTFTLRKLNSCEHQREKRHNRGRDPNMNS